MCIQKLDADSAGPNFGGAAASLARKAQVCRRVCVCVVCLSVVFLSLPTAIRSLVYGVEYSANVAAVVVINCDAFWGPHSMC